MQIIEGGGSHSPIPSEPKLDFLDSKEGELRRQQEMLSGEIFWGNMSSHESIGDDDLALWGGPVNARQQVQHLLNTGRYVSARTITAYDNSGIEIPNYVGIVARPIDESKPESTF